LFVCECVGAEAGRAWEIAVVDATDNERKSGRKVATAGRHGEECDAHSAVERMKVFARPIRCGSPQRRAKQFGKLGPTVSAADADAHQIDLGCSRQNGIHHQHIVRVAGAKEQRLTSRRFRPVEVIR
jgi:hypothetical protein